MCNYCASDEVAIIYRVYGSQNLSFISPERLTAGDSFTQEVVGCREHEQQSLQDARAKAEEIGGDYREYYYLPPGKVECRG